MSKTQQKLTTAKYVTVGLKHPSGLILRLFKEEQITEQSPSGPRQVKQHFPNLEAGTVEIKGYGGAAFGQVQPHRIIGQYALTPNVPADFIQEWLKQNKDHDLVKNNLIFIHAEEADAAAQGKEQHAVWDGLHPLRMHSAKKDPRVPKKVKQLAKNDADDATAETMAMTAPASAAA
jgi:hypothetical protein